MYLQSIIFTFHIILAVLIIVIVLLQRGKGSDAGAGFGAGARGSHVRHSIHVVLRGLAPGNRGVARQVRVLAEACRSGGGPLGIGPQGAPGVA